MSPRRVTLDRSGRVRIPVSMRRALGWNAGDTVLIQLHEGAVQIVSPREAISRAQAIVRAYVPADVSLVDELLAERRRESGSARPNP